MTSPDIGGGAPELREEALLYLRWVRGAVGRFDGGDPTPAAVSPTSPLPSSEIPPSRSSIPLPTIPPRASADSGVREGAAAVAADLDTPPPAEFAAPANSYDTLREAALACRRCRLCETRTNVVFGEGSRKPRLMVIGEAPGADEDESGKPFVGKAGQLLTRMLAAIGLTRDDVYIGNVLKCRPPGNRPPQPDEVATCRPFLQEQVRLLAPELLLLLGNHATKAVLGTDRGITSLRGQILETPDGYRALPTFHPAYLLRNPAAKKEVWLDLQLAAKTLGLEIPPAASRPTS